MSERLAFYMDVHIPMQVVLQLRAKGVDVIHANEVSLADADDESHLKYATEQNRVLVSLDRHFREWDAKWKAEGRAHSGIIALNPTLQGVKSIGRIVTVLYEFHELIAQGAGTLAADFQDRLLFITKEKP
jgi:hypothetical protein